MITSKLLDWAHLCNSTVHHLTQVPCIYKTQDAQALHDSTRWYRHVSGKRTHVCVHENVRVVPVLDL